MELNDKLGLRVRDITQNMSAVERKLERAPADRRQVYEIELAKLRSGLHNAMDGRPSRGWQRTGPDGLDS
jgi:hypothetical protein